MRTGRIVLLMITILGAGLLEGIAQRRGYIDNFDNGTLEFRRRSGQNQRPPYLLWSTVTPGTYALAENEGVLKIGYKKHEGAGAYDRFTFQPFRAIRVGSNPRIQVRVRSDVPTVLTVSPTYTMEPPTYEFLEKEIPGDSQWHTCTFDLTRKYYRQFGSVEAVDFYFDRDTSLEVEGNIEMDNFKIAWYIIEVADLQASVSDGRDVMLTWTTTDRERTGREIRINGFYDNHNHEDKWKVRFASGETGQFSYRLFVTDAGGSGESDIADFTVVSSGHHGWIRPSTINPHYFVHDDGTSFYGTAVYSPWRNNMERFNTMAEHGANLFAIWDITYGGFVNGTGLIEEELGRYNQLKAGRIDSMLSILEERNIQLMYAIWPHDLFSETVWAAQWRNNPYSQLIDVDDVYSDSLVWEYQKKKYRYMIARFGYSRSMGKPEVLGQFRETCHFRRGGSGPCILLSKGRAVPHLISQPDLGIVNQRTGIHTRMVGLSRTDRGGLGPVACCGRICTGYRFCQPSLCTCCI